MAMDFWKAQRQARLRTTIYLIVFFIMVFAVATVADVAFRYFAPPHYQEGSIPYLGLLFAGITLLVAGFNYLMYRTQGGGYVAEQLGGIEVDPGTKNPKLKQLLNIVEEMAVASSLPMPKVYVVEAEQINAFAAGLNQENAAVTVTTGALSQLNRDELQGVIAHELGHVYNADMRISMRLAAMIAGFVFLLFMGMRILQFGPMRSRDNGEKRGINPILLGALILIVAGAVSWLAGNILRCMVSRQRESLADACSVQFTRNPSGLISALKKLEKGTVRDMPQGGGAYAHLYLDDRSFWGSLFATHPPLKERIAALEAEQSSKV